jgi:hypothetical protein
MTNLSPDAQKVLDASMVHSGPAFETIVRRMLAAALRAAADQVVPLTKTPWNSTLIPVLTSIESREKLLAIATELEAE